MQVGWLAGSPAEQISWWAAAGPYPMSNSRRLVSAACCSPDQVLGISSWHVGRLWWCPPQDWPQVSLLSTCRTTQCLTSPLGDWFPVPFFRHFVHLGWGPGVCILMVTPRTCWCSGKFMKHWCWCLWCPEVWTLPSDASSAPHPR